MADETIERVNPFVGPRPFTRNDILYGRPRETEDLFNLLISGRIVLMYAASGAGKTSLIQAALIPRMLEEGFAVLDNLRVNLAPEPGPEAGSMNRYLYSIFDALEDARLGGHDDNGGDDRNGEPGCRDHLPAQKLLEMGLDGYLSRYHPQSPSLLVFDQFEEILTLNPVDLEAKRAFFDAVGQALQDPTRWALFSMREDYRAALDPYLEPLPTRLKSTYRLELLTRDAAIQVAINTAGQAGVDFYQGAATKLIENLSRVQVMRLDGTMEDLLGPFVEPVQLQVVGLDLFDRLPPGDTDITEAEIDQIGDVDEALGRYYGRQVAAIASQPSPDDVPTDLPDGQPQGPPKRKKRKKTKRPAGQELAEMVTRNWFEERLITPGGVRDQLLMAAGSSGGLENWRIDRLEDAHLVRKDRRRGRTWIELAHDRLVTPVRQNNHAWFRGRRLGSWRRAAPWIVGGALAFVPSFLVQGQPDWAVLLMLAGACAVVFALSYLLTTQLTRQLAMKERSIWIYKGSRILGLIMAISSFILLVVPVAVVYIENLEKTFGLLPGVILAAIGVCMLFISISFAGANALGRQITRLRLPHGLGFFAVFLAIFALILLCIGLFLASALG